MVKRLQSIAFWVVIGSAVLALGTTAGCDALPRGNAGWLWVLHPLLFAVGGAAGYATIFRHREIERERWQAVADPALTSGERDYAHREAEQQSRRAATWFFLAAIALGGVFAYQLRVRGAPGAADLLSVSPAVGFVLGLLVGSRRLPAEVPRF